MGSRSNHWCHSLDTRIYFDASPVPLTGCPAFYWVQHHPGGRTMLLSIIDSVIAGFALTVISYVVYAAFCLVRAWISNRRG